MEPIKLDIDDKQEVLKLTKGNSLAFRALYDKYAPKVYAFAFSYFKSKERSEEIVQEVFYKVWSKRKELQPELSFSSYVLTISKNLIIDCIRKNSLKVFFETQAKMELMTSCNNTDEQLILNDLQTMTDVAIHNLPPKRREIFTLSRQRNLSYSEISNHLGVSQKTVESQMSKALKSIRDYLRIHHKSGILVFFISLEGTIPL